MRPFVRLRTTDMDRCGRIKPGGSLSGGRLKIVPAQIRCYRRIGLRRYWDAHGEIDEQRTEPGRAPGLLLPER